MALKLGKLHALMLRKADVPKPTETEDSEEGPNDHLGEEPVDAPVGYAPRVVKVPMHNNADVSPQVHEAKQEAKKQNASTVEKSRSVEMRGDPRNVPNVNLIKGGPGSGPRKGGGGAAATRAKMDAYYAAYNARVGNAKPAAPTSTALAPTKPAAPAVKPEVVKPAVSRPSSSSRPAAADGGGRTLEVHDDPNHPDPGKLARNGAKYSADAHDKTAHAVAHPTEENHRKAFKAHEDVSAYHYHTGNVAAAREHDKASDFHRTALRAFDKQREQSPAKIDVSRFHKSFSPGENMSKNEVSDLFKSELGASAEKPLTKCIHCDHSLTSSDLRKGLGTSFVADDNDNPHDGSETGHVDPSRGVPGAKENDEIAPLLKGLKGSDAGDAEEFPIHKSEMVTMGMNADSLDDGWYTITKGEMVKQAPDHLDYLIDRKSRVAKGLQPSVNVLRKSEGSRSTTDGPHGYSPRAGGVHGPAGEQLVSWSSGSDAEVAKFIEKSGGFGPGTDESIKTQGRGY